MNMNSNTLDHFSQVTLLLALLVTLTFATGCTSTASPQPEPAKAATTLSEPATTIAQAAVITAASDSLEASPETARPTQLRFHFDFDQSHLSAEDQAIIEQHGRFLSEHPELKIVINGHSDTLGAGRYNDILSQKRAEHVAQLLIAQGVSPEQIETLGWGSSSPLPQATRSRDQRRVELMYQDEYLVNSTLF